MRIDERALPATAMERVLAMLEEVPSPWRAHIGTWLREMNEEYMKEMRERVRAAGSPAFPRGPERLGPRFWEEVENDLADGYLDLGIDCFRFTEGWDCGAEALEVLETIRGRRAENESHDA